jgi:hypothetical protein
MAFKSQQPTNLNSSDFANIIYSQRLLSCSWSQHRFWLVKMFLLKSSSRRCLFLSSSYTVSQVTSMGEKPEAFKTFEQDVFKALENQKRRDILRIVGERKIA